MTHAPVQYSMLSQQFFVTGTSECRARARSVDFSSIERVAKTQDTVQNECLRPLNQQATKEGQPINYSMFSTRFFVTESTERLGLRRSHATFVDLSSTPLVSDELQPQDATICGKTDDCESFSSSTLTNSSSHDPSRAIRLQGWMYWARREDSVALEAESYTKVYAVLRNEFLLLYRYDQRPCKQLRLQPLVHIAVASSWRSVSGVLHVKDPYDEEMELHLYGPEDFDMCRRWGDALELASEITQAHLLSLKNEELSQDSIYRGTLQNFRLIRDRSIRKSVPRLTQMKKSMRRLLLTQKSSRNNSI
ncbi:uncharacterized protein PHALS_01732 [Plasmopara halstedii]|uniref:PH domain-containing protein n=1 Tax=Plasmopara halstedii TaxID=4781 RepID=A0A0P1AXP0_PLAHL|nr:uncharacterized protein PHALS_01732 [Plasmopara halstedii]CEG45437.1 hypothetical protein PHALS_01732 [Plasmopara halstedii]|eukprot:XP_024581806.1 hypothetical protein PHALS_01732 [Plasmopara halstedii]